MANQPCQQDIDAEMHTIEAHARGAVEAGGSPELQPRRDYPSSRCDIRLQGEGETVFLDFHA